MVAENSRRNRRRGGNLISFSFFYAEKQEKKQTEERMAKLEDGIASLKGMVELLIKQKNGAN